MTASAGSISALQAQIDALGVRMDKNFDEIKVMMHDFGERVRSIETKEAGCAPLLNARLDAAWRTIDEHGKRIKDIEKLMPILNAVLWVGTFLGVSIIALIWSLITGQATVVFK